MDQAVVRSYPGLGDLQLVESNKPLTACSNSRPLESSSSQIPPATVKLSESQSIFGHGPPASPKRTPVHSKKRKEIVEADSESSEEINLPSVSKSGRRIIPARPFGRTSTRENASDRADKIVKKRQKALPTPSPVLACRKCGRRQAIEDNDLLTCAKCMARYHQFCHDPPVIVGPAGWQCADCVTRTALQTMSIGNLTVAKVEQLTGIQMGLRNRKRYFESLGKGELVGLLMTALAAHDDLVLFRVEEGASSFLGYPLSTATDNERTPPLLQMGEGIDLPCPLEYQHLLVDEDKTAWSHSCSGHTQRSQG